MQAEFPYRSMYICTYCVHTYIPMFLPYGGKQGEKGGGGDVWHIARQQKIPLNNSNQEVYEKPGYILILENFNSFDH